MSPDETRRLLAVASNLKVRTLLSLGYGCGLRASEVVKLKVKHIDSAQKIIRVEQSKGRKSLPSRRRGTAMSCCRRRRLVYCANGGRRGHRATTPQHPSPNAGCFPATGAASHRARGTDDAPLPAISCLGAFQTPAARAR
jgi:integrase